jgi:hypothetical protein
LSNKITDAINLKKIELAGEFFGDQQEEALGDDHREAQRKAMHKANDDAHNNGKINRTVHRTVNSNITAGHHDSDNPNRQPRMGRHQHLIQQARRAARPPSLDNEGVDESVDENNDSYYAMTAAKKEHEDQHGSGTWDRLQHGERDMKIHPHMKKAGFTRKGSSSGTYRRG